MRGIVVGRKNVQYKSRKTGKDVDAVSLFVQYEEKDVEGFCCEKIFIHRDSGVPDIDVIAVGDEINFYYNRFSQIDYVELAG